MRVRGAPLIGVTAAYGLALALRGTPPTRRLAHAARTLAPRGRRPSICAGRSSACAPRSRPCPRRSAPPPPAEALAIADEDVAINAAIGAPRPARSSARRRAQAGRRSTSSPTATPAGSPPSTGAPPSRPSTRPTTRASPSTSGSTRPARATRALLTAWELAEHGVPHTLIADNAGGHLMQHGMVDLVHRRRRPGHAPRRRRATRSAPT